MSVHQSTTEDNNERRSFLGILSGLIGGGISAVLGAPKTGAGHGAEQKGARE